MKKFSLKKRSNQRIRRRKTMKGGIIMNYDKKEAILTNAEKKKIKDIQEGNLKDKSIHLQVNEFIEYLKENNFDYNKIDDAHKRRAYEILLSLVTKRSYNGYEI